MATDGSGIFKSNNMIDKKVPGCWNYTKGGEKIPYKNKKLAKAAIKKHRMQGKRLAPYRCRHCGKWHLCNETNKGKDQHKPDPKRLEKLLGMVGDGLIRMNQLMIETGLSRSAVKRSLQKGVDKGLVEWDNTTWHYSLTPKGRQFLSDLKQLEEL